MTATIDAAALRSMINDGDELAILDVREEGLFSARHLLFARSVPLSRLELRLADLVPRRGTRIVLCDDADGLAERAAAHLAELGYSNVSILAGGIDGWAAQGFELFSGVYVPSKAFGEFVEETCHTPSIGAEELKAKLDAGENLVVLDSRPFVEYHRMNIPTGIDSPGAELAYRVHDAAPSPGTLVVVNCAGRTRSIIGAQSLINAGIPNRVMALRNGTMGWELAGFELERGQQRRAADPTPDGLKRALAVRDRVAKRYGVRTVDVATLDQWRGESDKRTLYTFDVRNPEEYEAGHLPGSRHAAGGQLVQATDIYAGTLGARIVLVDDNGVRATMTASWLIQMGWDDVYVLEGGLDSGALETGPWQPTILGLDEAVPDGIDPDALEAALAAGDTLVLDLAPSPTYREGHIPGAWFAIRARLATTLPKMPKARMVVLTSEDGVLARLAAAEAATAVAKPVKVLAGGTAAWRAAGKSLATGDENMADPTDDVWLRPYDRAKDVAAAMNDYLSWELGLMEQIGRDGTARFRRFPE